MRHTRKGEGGRPLVHFRSALVTCLPVIAGGPAAHAATWQSDLLVKHRKQRAMLLAALVLMLAPPPAIDPVSGRIVQLCKGRPACVSKQRRGMQHFFLIVARSSLSVAVTQGCIRRANKGYLTDWSKAASCLAKRRHR